MDRETLRPILRSTPLLIALWFGTGCPEPVDDDDDATETYDEVQVEDVAWSLNPEIASLVLVSWTQLAPATAYLEYSFDEGEWLESRAREVGEGARSQLLLGVPYGAEVTFRVVNDFGDGPLATGDFVATTGPLPEGLPVAEVLASDPARYEPTGRYLLGSVNEDYGGWTVGDYWTFIVDRLGRVVWARPTPDRDFTIYVRVSATGDDILIDQPTYWTDFDGGEGSQIHRIKIDGSVVQTHDTPGLHHAFVDLPDGSVVWGAADDFDETLEKLHPDGSQETLWVCSEYLASIDYSLWCQSNTLTWHEDSDSFLYSFFTFDSILQIDHATGDLLRSFGQAPGSWAFEPEESAFWFQHGCSFTDEGTLLTSSHATAEDYEGVVREYALDEGEEVLQQVWSFGIGEGIRIPKAGEAHRLPGGNTLHNYGTSTRVREVTPGGDVVWDVTWGEGRLLGRTVLLDDLYDLAP